MIVTPVSIVQLAFMDLQARDTFTSAELVKREKIAKKANNKCLLCDVQTNVYYPRGHKWDGKNNVEECKSTVMSL